MIKTLPCMYWLENNFLLLFIENSQKNQFVFVKLVDDINFLTCEPQSKNSKYPEKSEDGIKELIRKKTEKDLNMKGETLDQTLDWLMECLNYKEKITIFKFHEHDDDSAGNFLHFFTTKSCLISYS